MISRNVLAIVTPVAMRVINLRELKESSFLRILKGSRSVLLYHTLLGNLHFAEPSILQLFELIEQCPSVDLDVLQSHFPEVDIAEQIVRLRKLQFLVMEDEDSRALLKCQRKDIQFEEGQLVSALRLNVSTACNLSCSYCYGQPQEDQQTTQTMTSRIAERAIRAYVAIMRQHGKKKLIVRFFGGEPLLNWPVMYRGMKDVIALARRDGMRPALLINTNGTLLTREIVDKLCEFNPYLRLIISLDGRAQEHNLMRRTKLGQDSFDLAFAGLKRVQQMGLDFTTSLVVSQHNIEELRNIVDFFVSEGVFQTGLNPVLITGQNEQNALTEKLLDAVTYAKQQGLTINSLWMRPILGLDRNTKESYCSGSGSELSIAPDGSIYPCQTQPFLLGNLDDLETRALFKTDTYRHVVFRTAGNIAHCRGCDIEGLCAGGCAGDAYAVYEDIYAPTQYCGFMQAVTKAHLAQLMQDFEEYRKSRMTDRFSGNDHNQTLSC